MKDKKALTWRALITLDADFIAEKSSVIIPLSRPITPDEYQTLSRFIASDKLLSRNAGLKKAD